MVSFLVLFLIASLACLGEGAASVRGADAKNRPVSKVVNLLKDIVAQLEKEGSEDQEIYEQMGCWCSTNDKEKTHAIKKGRGRVEDLTHTIEDLLATSSRLNTEIGNLNMEVGKNEEALDSATALRKRQLAEFNAEESDMLQSLTSLKGAVVALSKHHGAAFLQQSVSSRELSSTEAIYTIQHELYHHAGLLGEVVTPHQRKLLISFLHAPDADLDKQMVLLQDGQPQSGEIFGVLKSMKESFEVNLAQSQKEEAENSNAYEDLKKAKEAELAAGRSQADTKAQELASTDEKHAQAKQDLADTQNTLDADVAYLANLKEHCQETDQQYEARTQTRQLEIKATAEALAFLSSDDAHDVFTRTFNPAFIQEPALELVQQRQKLVKVLRSGAQKSGDPRLSTLATSARLDSFSKVKKQIQDMVDKLTQDKEDEIKKKDYCIDTITEIDSMDTTEKQRDKADLVAKIDDLRMSIDGLTRDIEDLKVAVAEEQLQLKRASVDREKANQEFLVVVSDQRATQKLLQAALTVLKGFYDKAALLEMHSHSVQPAGPPPPPGFKSYEKNAAQGGVMGLIQRIIDDAHAMEEEAVRGEADSQKAYEDFVQETSASIQAMNEDMTSKGSSKAKAEADSVQRQKELDKVNDVLMGLGRASKDIHYECDFLLKNFEIRQSTRDDEIYSLQQSLSIFTGASFNAFLQGSV